MTPTHEELARYDTACKRGFVPDHTAKARMQVLRQTMRRARDWCDICCVVSKTGQRKSTAPKIGHQTIRQG